MIGRLRAGLRWLANAFLARFGALLLCFGLGLFLLGAGVQTLRVWQLSAAERTNVEPDFAASLAVEPGAGLGAGGLWVAPNRIPPAELGSLVPSDPDATFPVEAQPAPTAAPVLPDRIVIPAIDVDSPVVEVGWEARIVSGGAEDSVWQTADFAAGYHQGSAPLGQAGNTVISGHNNIQGSVFQDLHTLEPGAVIYLYAGDRRWAYAVEHSFIVWEEGASAARRRANAHWIEPTPDERLTLVSCYPPWGNSHRVIIVARPAADPVAEVSESVVTTGFAAP